MKRLEAIWIFIWIAIVTIASVYFFGIKLKSQTDYCTPSEMQQSLEMMIADQGNTLYNIEDILLTKARLTF